MKTREEVLSKLENRLEKQKNESLIAASKLYDYMEKRLVATYHDGRPDIFAINDCKCICTHYDFEVGFADFKPLNMEDNIGSGAGGMLTIKF